MMNAFCERLNGVIRGAFKCLYTISFSFLFLLAEKIESIIMNMCVDLGMIPPGLSFTIHIQIRYPQERGHSSNEQMQAFCA